jgi:hypothetical protein
MEFSNVAPPDTSDIMSNTKFTARFNRPSAQCQSHTQNPATGNEILGVAGFTYNFKNPGTQYRSGIDFHFD